MAQTPDCARDFKSSRGIWGAIQPLAIRLTILASGTASPELADSLQAASFGLGSLTLGNVPGSSIFNILFVLGMTALVAPIILICGKVYS